MDLYGCHFDFAGVSSRCYDLIFISANTNRITFLEGEKRADNIYSKKENKNYFVRENLTDSPVSFDAEIMTENERVIEHYERRKIEKWLFGQTGYQKLYVDITDDISGDTYELIDGEQKRLYLNCRFTNPEKLESNGGIVGYKFTIECDTCMAWQDAIVKTYTLDNNSETSSSIISVNVDTDLNDYIYPKVTINIGSVGGDIIISNNNDDESRFTKFIGLTPYTSLIMKGSLNYISGQSYEKFSNRNFIRFLDGENKLTIMGDVVSIEFEWQNRRFL